MRAIYEPDPYAPFYIREYEDWTDMVNRAAVIDDNHEDGWYQGLQCASLDPDKTAWSGTRSLREAIHLARYGWSGGRTDVQRLLDKLQIEQIVPKTEQLMPEFSFAGDEVDVGRMLAGNSEHMVTWRPKELFGQGRTIRVLVNRRVVHTVGTDEIMRRGTAVLIAMHVLELIGYSVEITLGFSCVSNSDGMSRFEEYVPIKQAGEVLDLDTAAFMLVHPAVLRRLMFACEEMENTEIRRKFGFESDRGYGRPEDVLSTDGYDLVVGGEEGLTNYDDQVIPFALKLLRRVGVDMDDIYVPKTGT